MSTTERLEPGMTIRTNYGREEYTILEVTRGCTCPSFRDSMNMKNPPPRPPHLHLVCYVTGDPKKTKRWLNGFDEATLRSLEKTYCGKKTELDYDYITITGQDGNVQLSLF